MKPHHIVIKRPRYALDDALAVLVDGHRDDDLLQAVVVARNAALAKTASRLFRRLDELCWKRVGEIEEGR